MQLGIIIEILDILQVFLVTEDTGQTAMATVRLAAQQVYGSLFLIKIPAIAGVITEKPTPNEKHL